MSAILYKRVDGEVVEERVKPTQVANLLENGYFSSPELASADKNETGKLSNKEIREAAKAAIKRLEKRQRRQALRIGSLQKSTLLQRS